MNSTSFMLNLVSMNLDESSNETCSYGQVKFDLILIKKAFVIKWEKDSNDECSRGSSGCLLLFTPFFPYSHSFSLHTLTLVHSTLPFLPAFTSPPFYIFLLLSFPLLFRPLLILFLTISPCFFSLSCPTLWLHYSYLNQPHPAIQPFSPSLIPFMSSWFLSP